MFNTMINGSSFSSSITSAEFCTHPNNLMGGRIKGKIQNKSGHELCFNTMVIFKTKADDRFAFESLSGMNYFVLSREPMEVNNQADIQAGIKVIGFSSDVTKQFVIDYLTEIGYNQYTLSHTKEVIFNLEGAESITA